MKEQQIQSFPASRVATMDVGRISRKKHLVSSFLEIDVTEARRNVKSAIRRGEAISFQAWLIHGIAKTIAKHPEVQAFKLPGNRRLIFDDVDMALPLERMVKGNRVPLALLITGAQDKSVEEIHREIEEARRKPIEKADDYVLNGGKSRGLFFHLPGFLRMFIWKLLLNNPRKRKQAMGTVVITNAGLLGATPGWMLPSTMHNLSFAMGSICKKPRAVDGTVEVRDVLHLTVSFDHDVVDGAPAARFVQDLVRVVEAGVL